MPKQNIVTMEKTDPVGLKEEINKIFINKNTIVNGIFNPNSVELNILLFEIKYTKKETLNVT